MIWKLTKGGKVVGFVRGVKAVATAAVQRLADRTGDTYRISNPTQPPRVGEIWRGIRGDRCRIVKVAGSQVTVLQLDSGHRVTSHLSDFLATYKPPPGARTNPKRRGRNPRKDGSSTALEAFNDGKRNGRADKLLGRRSEYAWNTSEDEPNFYIRHYAKGYRVGWAGGKSPRAKRKGRNNPGRDYHRAGPRAGSYWRWLGTPGHIARVVKTERAKGGMPPMVNLEVVEHGTGTLRRLPVVVGTTRVPVNEFFARYEATQPQGNPSRTKLTWQLYGAGPGAFRAATGIGDYYVNTQRAQTPTQVRAGSKERGRGKVVGVTIQLNTYAPDAKGFHWTDLGAARSASEAKAKAQADWDARSAAFPNPSRTKTARAKRRYQRAMSGSRRVHRARKSLAREVGTGRWISARAKLKEYEFGRRVRSLGLPEKEGRFSGTGRRIGVAARARIGRRPRANPEGRVRVVYNKLLGGWYVVTGPHQTPLNGRFDSKAAAQAWLAGGPQRRSNPPKLARKIRRATKTGRFVKAQHYQARSTARGARRREAQIGVRSSLRTNPKLSVPERHQLKIARDTLKMTDAGARIMGGPTKAEAREIIYRLTGRWPTEPNRRRKGRVTANPRSEMARAKKTYEMWSEMKPGAVTKVRAPKRVPKVMARLGELHSVVYKSDKYDGKSKLYEHKTKRPRPVLATDPDGRDVFVVGGRMKVTADGLVN